MKRPSWMPGFETLYKPESEDVEAISAPICFSKMPTYFSIPLDKFPPPYDVILHMSNIICTALLTYMVK